MALRPLGEFPSSSSDKVYVVSLDESTNRLTCPDCTGWKMKRPGKVRECKHTKKVLTQLLAQGWRSEVRDDEVYVYAPGGAAPSAPVMIETADPVAAPTGAKPSLEALRAAAARKRAEAS